MKKGELFSSSKSRSTLRVGLIALCALSVGSILFLTLFPFQFEQFERIWRLPHFVQGIKFGGYSRCCKHLAIIEPALNVLLFMPFGFAATGLLRNYSASLKHRLGLVLLVSLGMTISVEFLQVFQPWRSASLTDVLMNVTGGVLGGCVYLLLVQIFTRRS